VKLDTVAFNSMMSTCEVDGNWEKALKLISRMPRIKLKLDTFTFSATINACKNGLECRAVLQFLRMMIQNTVERDCTCFVR
jgi:pentatricopeptide repeat protein